MKNPFIWKEAYGLLVGDKIGRGMSRVAHECPLDKRFVIKVENREAFFQNVVEWETWQRVKDTPTAKWFAPCIHISSCGTVLIQRRTQAMRLEELPKRMPAFFADFKRTNYGLIDGQVACHDYGTSLVFEKGFTASMQAVEWHDR